MKQRKDEITSKAREHIDSLGSNRCKICTIPRPCRHHEKELYRSTLSMEALDKEMERDEKSPKYTFRKGVQNDPLPIENSITL
jgi:hypothetical protein